jgi:hypothetical protein
MSHQKPIQHQINLLNLYVNPCCTHFPGKRSEQHRKNQDGQFSANLRFLNT